MEILFAEIQNGVVVKFPYNMQDLIADNPNTKFKYGSIYDDYLGTEKNLNGYEIVRVYKLAPPLINVKTQICVQGEPKLMGQEWILQWVIRDKTPDEFMYSTQNEAADVRAMRTQKLKDSDWTQVADAPVDQAAWAAYRQALRDVPSQAGFPWEVQWPTQPE